MLLDIGLMIVGLVILVMGGDYLVRGASNIALRLHLSPLVVGLTIVAFGTSAPELLISLNAALSGSPDLTMGNVIGSNICNLALVLGTTAVICPIPVTGSSTKIDWPMAMGASLLLYFLALEGIIVWWEGLIFIAILVLYTVFIIRKSRSETKMARAIEQDLGGADASKGSVVKDYVFIGLGAAGLFFGADWFVGGAQSMARLLGVDERVIGLTVLALGTSLPELVTAIVAAVKKETDLALGNLLGSNIFNVLSILGITSIVKSIHVNEVIVNVDLLWMLGITLVVLPIMLTSSKIDRMEGFFLLTLYSLYIFLVVA